MTESGRAHAAMLVFTLLISSSFTVGEAITNALSPVPLTFARFVLASVIFVVLLLVLKRPLARPNLADIGRYAWLALLLVLYFVLMFEALRWTDSLSTGAIFTLAPPMTAAISYFLLDQRLSAVEWLALAIAGSGAIWIIFDGDPGNLARFSIGWGEFIFLVGALCYAAYSPSMRKLHRGEDLTVLTFYTLAAAVVLLAAYGWRELAATQWSSVPWPVYAGIAHLAVFTTAASAFLIQYASLRLPSGKVMAYTYLIPAFIVVQNVVFRGAAPSAPVLFGVAVIASAMVVLQVSSTRH